MSTPRRSELAAEARRRNLEQLSKLGAEVRRSRRRRRWTQAQLASVIGVVQSTVSELERGHGGMLSLDLWQRAFVALDRRLLVDASRDPAEEPADVGHLKIQELVLRLGRPAGYRGTFELQTRPNDPSRSADVGLRDDTRRRLVLVECWNTIGDIGAAARSSARKLAEAEAFGVAVGGERAHTVTGCWVVRGTARNRGLVATYPAVFRSRFPGSSERWVEALTTGAQPPAEPGLVWCDIEATRLFAWRRRARLAR